MTDEVTRRRLSGPGMRTFLNIADAWGLTDDQRIQLLGRPPRAVFDDWVSKARRQDGLSLDVATLLRISAVLNIYQALVVLVREEGALGWLNAPQRGAPFGGRTPVEVMTQEVKGFLVVLGHLQDRCAEEVRGGMGKHDVPADLLEIVERMLAESGGPEAQDFDAGGWLAAWLNRPLSALGGCTPASFLDTTEGRETVKAFLLRMQSGAYS